MCNDVVFLQSSNVDEIVYEAASRTTRGGVLPLFYVLGDYDDSITRTFDFAGFHSNSSRFATKPDWRSMKERGCDRWPNTTKRVTNVML